MKTITKIQYQCEICLAVYNTQEEAKSCEAKSSVITTVKKGDKIIITQGDGTGQEAIVEETKILDRLWANHAWERYWHTIAITAKLKDGRYRFLTFDDYKKI